MAGAAVRSVLSKLADDAAVKKAIEAYALSNDVEMMMAKLRIIQGFLKDADATRNKNESVKAWVEEVRRISHKISDAVDEFIVEIEESKPGRSTAFRAAERLVTNPIKVGGFCEKIKEIKANLQEILDVAALLGIKLPESDMKSKAPSRPSELSGIDISGVVGFDSHKSAIIEHLLDDRISRRTVLTVVGMGGLGKTTLAKTVYESSELASHFHCRIWLPIPRNFNLAHVMRDILCSIDPKLKKRKRTLKDEDLVMLIRSSVSEKRYLIILDDVWTIESWDELKKILPDEKNGSRVIITSRSLDIAFAADRDTTPYKLPCLDEVDSLTLLLKKALPNKQPGKYNVGVERVAKQLTKKCGSLPLALIVLGGILSRKKETFSDWKSVEVSMDWHDEEGKKCSQVLAMSYDDLPHYLKRCFLYFASFPDNDKISAKHVTRMWIAEGFIPEGLAIEVKAQNCLEELVQRCLIQVTEKSWNGWSKYCNVHNLIQDLAIHEAKKDNFFTVHSETKTSSSMVLGEARRVALQYCTPTKYGKHPSKTHSLHFYGEYILTFSGFKMLRVLSIEGVTMTEREVSYKSWLEGLVHLRYLGFIDCGVLPRGFGRVSFRSLKNFETLEFTNSSSESPNNSLWRIPTLRHVIFPSPIPFTSWDTSIWEYLKNLQTLKWVSLQNFPKLECDINLRKIGLSLGTEFWKQCESVEEAGDEFRDKFKCMLRRMKFLVSLSVSSVGREPFPIGDSFVGCVPFPIGDISDLPCYEEVQYLWLSGIWLDTVVDSNMFPKNLTKLTLIGSRLEQDPMPILEKLQILSILQLREYSYMGKKLICSTGGFPNLQKLQFNLLPNLTDWEINEGAMPNLSQIKIGRCYRLGTIPNRENLPTLQDLVVNEEVRSVHT